MVTLKIRKIPLSAIESSLEKRPRMLPNYVYSDRDIAQEEIEKIFCGDFWIPALDTSNMLVNDPLVRVNELGDVTPFSFFGNSLLLARDMNGLSRCFSNICTHWQQRLLCESAANVANTGRIICPLHDRVFDLNGTCAFHKMLIERPSQEDNLQKFQSQELNNLLSFISMGTPIALSEFLLPLDFVGILGFLKNARRVRQKRTDKRILAGNWKQHCLLFLDQHHVGSIHPSLSKLIMPESYHETLYKDVALQWAYARDPAMGIDQKLFSEEFREENKICNDQKVFAIWWFIFPSTCILVFSWGVAIYCFFPHGDDPTKTKGYWIQYSTNIAKFKRRHVDWHHQDVNEEDIYQTKFMDTPNLLSQCPPRFTEQEACAHWFQRRYIEALLE
jgi:phenylpropionate dioxygenase-like ring-hydroxylating dioxygenase large terminal subunit